MFAFAVRLRRGKNKPEKEVIKKPDSSSAGVYVGAGFLLLFFGSLFLFFELYGHCGCSGDIVGYIMVTIGTFLVTFYCIKDLIQTIKDELFDDENIPENVDENDNISVISAVSDAKFFNNHLRDNNQFQDNLKPFLISRELDPINEEIKLDNIKDIRIIPCQSKISPKTLTYEYELPSVVVDT